MISETEAVQAPVRHVDPRYISARRLSAWVTFGVVMSVWAVSMGLAIWNREAGLRWLDWVIGFTGLLLAIALIFRATVWPARIYQHLSYHVDDHGIEIHAGVYFRTVTNVPRSRVQHTDVSQGPMERRFGLGTLVVYTAGTEFAQVDLPGLAHETATRIRDMLLPKDGDDAV